MTIGELLKGLPTLDQYDVLQRADLMFESGRYYSGQLTEQQVEELKPKKAVRT